MSTESKVRFEQDGALGTLTLDSPPLNLIGQALIADLLDAAVGLFDTDDARGGIRTFLESGPGKAAFAGR
jgi:enoyl-CoA hydratase/carnithine racemase